MSIVISGPFAFADGLEPMATIGSLCAVLGVSVSGHSCVAPTAGEQAQHREPRPAGRHPPRMPRVAGVTVRRASMQRCGPPADASGATVSRASCACGLRGLAAIPRRVRTTDSRHDYPPPIRVRGETPLAPFQPASPGARTQPNRLRRNFTASAPNQVWLADLTYIRTGEGWFASGFRGPTGATVPAHFAALIDMHTRVRTMAPRWATLEPSPSSLGPVARSMRPTSWLTVGWSMRETLHASIALEALDMAIRRQRPAPGVRVRRRPSGSNRWRRDGQLSNAWRRDGSLQHSDRGIQYAADEYRQALAAAKITPSMSRKGNCLEFKPVRASGSNGPGDHLKAQNAPMEVRPLFQRIAFVVSPTTRSRSSAFITAATPPEPRRAA